MNTTEQTVAFLKKKRDSGTRNYKGLCMRLAREARGFDYGIYPSALSCMLATPKKYRVTDQKKVKVGMVGFFVDPDDSNPYEHIATCVGHDKDGDPIWGTNLADGSVRFVSHRYFARHWGDHFKFAASSLGTHVIEDLQPKPVERGKRLKKTIRELEKIAKQQRKLGREGIARRLDRDIADLRDTLKRLQAKK